MTIPPPQAAGAEPEAPPPPEGPTPEPFVEVPQ